MKKIIIVSVLAFILFKSTTLLAVIGPIPLDEANSTSLLPDGIIYASVVVTLLPDGCPGSYDGVKIKVDVDQTLLVPVPGAPYGVQTFGFNTGDSIDTDNLDITLPTAQWGIKENAQVSEFGRFEVYAKDNNDRQDPLYLTICDCCADLKEEDFVVKNDMGYVFSSHIAGFSYNGIEVPSNSAFFGTQKTTEIQLAYFKAVSFFGTGMIVWATETEKENAGFNIYRADSEDGEYVKINDAQIAAKGSATAPALYRLLDKGLEKNKIYYYKLEDIDNGGVSRWNGPFKMQPLWMYLMSK